MHISANTVWLSKNGNSIEEYEDAFFPEDEVDQDFLEFNCAIADGATESINSGIWAKSLVEEYVNNQVFRNHIQGHLSSLQSKWLETVGGKDLPWYLEEKVRRGAFSSLLGLTLRETQIDEGEWEAIAVGDSCLFIVRDDKLLESFPLVHSNDFNNQPYLISSNPASNEKLTDNIKYITGKWKIGDTFYLMTDAIAHWTMKRNEENDGNVFLDFSEQMHLFDNLVEKNRITLDSEGKSYLKNDDVTLYRISVI